MTWTLVHLLRHGATASTERGLVCGQRDVPLSPRGEDDARRAARLVAALVGPGCRVSSSDLTRARQTASFVAAALGGEQVVVQILPELRERGMGSIEGRAWADVPADYDFSDAEPENEFARRSMLALRLAAEKGGEVVVVTHAGCIGVVLDALGLGPRNVAPGEIITVEADAVGRIRQAPAANLPSPSPPVKIAGGIPSGLSPGPA